MDIKIFPVRKSNWIWESAPNKVRQSRRGRRRIDKAFALLDFDCRRTRCPEIGQSKYDVGSSECADQSVAASTEISRYDFNALFGKELSSRFVDISSKASYSISIRIFQEFRYDSSTLGRAVSSCAAFEVGTNY